MPELDASDALKSLAFASAEPSVEATLQQVVDLAIKGVTGCTMAAITLLGQGGPTTAVATSDVAARVDQVQYKSNAGPCLDAYRRQVLNRIDSTYTDERWPVFCRAAFAAGVLAILSFPLVVGGDGLGALNLYSSTESAFDENSERSGAIFAAHASITVANARAFWRTEELRRNLEEALCTRGVIDQAKGMLMARDGVSADDAFELLKRASQRTNRKVHDLAQEIVDATRRGTNDGS